MGARHQACASTFRQWTEDRITEGVRRIGAAADDVLTLSRSLGLSVGNLKPRAGSETGKEVPK